ncbi:antibiotic biosynthesis monooxygenase family protein [Nocardia tengchongensis]|uniref:antibiotic biosynthesis monooxygenase family protein n=1 Tax=Nocardia tengchongensis TaxID=2055889 RepID=UPI003656A794
MHLVRDTRSSMTAPAHEAAKHLPLATPSARVVVANCITGPRHFSHWIASSFLATYATLSDVSGVQEFRLSRQADPAADHCLFISYTLWDDLGDFERWRTSAAFVAAHPTYTQFRKQFKLMKSIRYDIPATEATTIDDHELTVLDRLAADHPYLITGTEWTDEIRWTANPHATLLG